MTEAKKVLFDGMTDGKLTVGTGDDFVSFAAKCLVGPFMALDDRAEVVRLRDLLTTWLEERP